MKKTEIYSKEPKNLRTPVKDECPAHKCVYILSGVLILVYSMYLYDVEAFHGYAEKYKIVKPFELLFRFIEKYSPFQEFINEGIEEVPSPQEDRLFTKEELKSYDGSATSKGLFLAILGQVFDVSNGKQYYGSGGGYSFFLGRDASRAYVTGNFDEKGLIDDVSGLSYGDYIGLAEWLDLYHTNYRYVGKLVGRFYDEEGQETEEFRELEQNILEARKDADKRSSEKHTFPPCNSEWTENTHRVWCTNQSGGITRPWIGVPRILFYPGREERCACVRDTGPPSSDPNAKTQIGDLGNSHLREYPNCSPDSISCMVNDG